MKRASGDRGPFCFQHVEGGVGAKRPIASVPNGVVHLRPWIGLGLAALLLLGLTIGDLRGGRAVPRTRDMAWLAWAATGRLSAPSVQRAWHRRARRVPCLSLRALHPLRIRQCDRLPHSGSLHYRGEHPVVCSQVRSPPCWAPLAGHRAELCQRAGGQRPGRHRPGARDRQLQPRPADRDPAVRRCGSGRCGSRCGGRTWAGEWWPRPSSAALRCMQC